MNNYYGNYAANGMGYNPYYGAGYNGQPMQFNPVQAPVNENALTNDEMKVLQNVRTNALDLNISVEDNLRSICTHKQNNQDIVRQLNGGMPNANGELEVHCPLCQETWDPTNLSKEEVKEFVHKIISAMQNCKWAGDLNTSLVRDYFPMIPLLKKFPDIYEYSMKQFNRYMDQNQYSAANDASVYGMYNQLTGNYNNYYSGFGYGYPQQNMAYNPGMGTVNGAPYGQQNVGGAYYNQPQTMYPQQNMNGGYYNQPASTMYGQQAPMQNPMQAQAPYGQQAYGQPPMQNMQNGQMPQATYSPAGVNQGATNATTAQPDNKGEATTASNVKIQ